MAANWRAGAFTCVIGGLMALALAGCALTDAPQPTATLIVIELPTDSPRPPSPTATTTRTAAPTATNSPTAAPSSTATDVPPTDTVEPPTATSTATKKPTAAATVAPAATSTEPTAGDFTPTAVSIWDIPNPGEDVASGDCSNSFTPSYGLVQITPQGDTLGWKNQEPAPYTFSRLGPNVWQYSGPSSVGDGTVTMTVTFTSATTFELTHSFVPTDSPNCTHTHQMFGTFRNFR